MIRVVTKRRLVAMEERAKFAGWLAAITFLNKEAERAELTPMERIGVEYAVNLLMGARGVT